MTRHQIAETAYEAILRLNRLKAKYGVISKQMAEIGERRIKAASRMMHRIDDILAGDNQSERLSQIKTEVDEVNALPVGEKVQLEVPIGLVKLIPWHSLWSWLTRR